MTISRFRTLASAFLIFNFAFLIAHAAAIPGTVILNKITLGDDSITNKAIGDTVEMKGTPKQVANTAARDAIPAVRRTEGMECWVVDIASSYRLIGGILNANWTVITNGSGTDASSLITGIVPDGRLPSTNRNYASIFEMVADSFAPKGTVAHVESYYGTNSYGGGIFKKDTTSTAATNYGTVFAATGGGRWRRSTDGTNVLRAEWFGVYPANSGVPSADTNDQRVMMQNAIDTLPKRGGRLIQPGFPIGVSRLDFTNFFGMTWEGDTRNQDGAYDASLSWPANQPSIFHVGPSNNILITHYNCGATVFRGIGFEAHNPHNLDEMANVCVDVDQPGVSVTSTGDAFINCTFRGSAYRTNALWRGIRIAYTSWQNCEFNVIKGCYFQAGFANYWYEQPAEQGYAIEVGGGGGGGNSFGNRIIDGVFQGVSRAVSGVGQWYIDGFNGTGGQLCFYLNSVGDNEINNCRVEGMRQFLNAPEGRVVMRNNAPAAVLWEEHPTGVAMIDTVDLTIIGGGGSLESDNVTWAVTNSTASVNGRLSLTMAGFYNPNLVAWDKFRTEHTAHGSFASGEVNDWNWIQKFPLSTWSAQLYAARTNGVFKAIGYTDATTPTLKLVPDFGRVQVGPTAQAATLSISDTNEVTVIFSDSKYNPRWMFLPDGVNSHFRSYSAQNTTLELYSTNSQLKFISGAGANTIQYVSGSLFIQDPAGNSVMTLTTAGAVAFPQTNTFSVTGPATFSQPVISPFFSGLASWTNLVNVPAGFADGTDDGAGGGGGSGPVTNAVIGYGSAERTNAVFIAPSGLINSNAILANAAFYPITLKGAPGLESSYAGLWMTTATPDTTNFRILGSDAYTYLNGPDALTLRVGNVTRLELDATDASFTLPVIVPDDAYDSTAWNGSLAVPTKNAIRDKIESMGGSGGSSTNAILMLEGFGTNTYLLGVTLGGVQTNDSLIVSGSITRTNYTTGVRSVESAAGHLFYPSNSVVPTVNINGVTGDVTATQFIGAGGGLTYTGSGNNGNLATSVDTVQELNDAVDNLSLGAGGGATNAVTTVSTNGTALTTAATNLNFWQGTGITITGTNLGGLVGMRFDAGSALATDAEVAAAYIASNAGSGTNNSFTGSTNYGNSFRTNWTWMDSRGWHNTNNSAAGQGVDISAGAITANSFSAVTFNLGTLNLTNALGLAAGGTGSSLSDPGAHRLWGWDDTDGAIKWFTLGSGLSYDAGTDTISATASGTGDVTAAANFGADNSLVRSDGTSKGVQASGIVVTDTGALTNVDSISISNRIYNYLGGFILEWDTSSIQYFHQDGSGVMLEGFSDGTAVFKSGNTSASITLADDATITFVGDIRIPQSAAPTPNAIGEIAFDNDVYSGGQGALKIYDGTDVQVLVGVLATEVPTDGQRPTWHQAGITWDTGPSLTGTNAWTGSNYFIYATVADEVYDATAWNGSLAVPTKNAIRDKIESMAGGGGGSATNAVTTISSNNVAISTAATNLHFWAGANMTLGFTNSPSGDVDVGIAGTNIFTTVNALDFGLVAGGADQTAILQAAVNVAATSGKRVFIPAAPANGWYRLNGTVHLPTGVTLEGEFASGAQHQGTRFYAGDSAKTMVMIDGPGVAIRNIQFFDNNPATGTVAIQSSTNVPSSPATEVIIENCAFMGIGVGIQLAYAWHWDINNCYGEDVGTGIWASNAVNAINVNGGHWVGTQGIYLAGTENYGWNIESRFETCTRAVVITNWAYQVNIRGSYFEGNTASIVAGGNAGSTPLRGLAISDNVFVNTLSGTNITLLNAAGVIVQNNTFTGAGVGIAAASTVVDLKDLNNYYQNNSNWIAATVSVMKTDTNLTITGGQINGSGLGLTNVSGLRTTAGSATLAASGQVSVNTTSKMLGIHNGTKEVAIPLIEHREFSFDPKAVCDGAVDRLFLFKVGAWAPNGITITGWRVSFEADPTTEVDLDLKRADAFIGVANSAVMDVLDTTTGASSEATAANINSGAVVANGKVVYLEFGTAYTETTHQIIVELEYEVEED